MMEAKTLAPFAVPVRRKPKKRAFSPEFCDCVKIGASGTCRALKDPDGNNLYLLQRLQKPARDTAHHH